MKVKENLSNDLLCYFIVDGNNQNNWENIFREKIIPQYQDKISIVQIEMGPMNHANKIQKPVYQDRMTL